MRYFTCLIAFIFCSLPVYAQDHHMQGPVIRFSDSGIYNASLVRPNHSYRICFCITNTGNKTLHIDSIFTAAGYSYQKYVDDIRVKQKQPFSIVPGKTRRITLTWKPASVVPANDTRYVYIASDAVNSNSMYYRQAQKNVLKITGFVYDDTVKGALMYFPGGTTYDFGNATEGPNVQAVYEFENIGTEPLIIQNCGSSCGCLVPLWSKEPIMPGRKGKITAIYSTMGRTGPCQKSIFINSNDVSVNPYQRLELTIRGNVVKAPEGLQATH